MAEVPNESVASRFNRDVEQRAGDDAPGVEGGRTSRDFEQRANARNRRVYVDPDTGVSELETEGFEPTSDDMEQQASEEDRQV